MILVAHRLTTLLDADRILVSDDGRAAGVQATVTHPDGSSTSVTVQAPTVVVAGGAIESPALLLRSGIGGPAVGKHLRLHPGGIVNGIYDEPIEAWIGELAKPRLLVAVGGALVLLGGLAEAGAGSGSAQTGWLGY